MEDGMERLSVVDANLSIIDYNNLVCGVVGFLGAPSNPPVATEKETQKKTVRHIITSMHGLA
jgi:hypothetical protein